MKSQSFAISKKKGESCERTSWRHMLAQAEALRHGCAISLITSKKLICDIMRRPFFKCFWKSVVNWFACAGILELDLPPSWSDYLHDNSSRANYLCCTFLLGKKRQINIYVTFTIFSPHPNYVWATRGLKRTPGQPLNTISSRCDSQNPRYQLRRYFFR